mmetsp:Transcript_5670/g.8320  ORF Transcript_5670/g.8320 Transcript_5670/m.8320 type:complete len:116 (+) Transcript_5670:1745-2092(+)
MVFVPKKDKVSMQTVGNFRQLNELLIRSPKFIEPINDLLASLGAWNWASNIDFNMGYYAMELCPTTQKFVCLVTIWGIYKCLVLATETSPSSGIFQRRVTNRVVDIKPRPPQSLH